MGYAVHDKILMSLKGTGPELRNGAPNHAPMVLEALAALDRENDASSWIERRRPQLSEAPEAQGVVGHDWERALGDINRLGEWYNLFRRELGNASWAEVVEQWLPKLIPGSMAAGTHGIIRCGHAVRALANEVTDARLDELSAALAYCASRYRTVGGVPCLGGRLDLGAALREIPLLDEGIDRRGPPPNIVKLLNERPAFTAAVNALEPPQDRMAALVDLAELGARLYLSNASRHPLVLLHAVTGPAAVHLVVATASPDLRNIAFAYIWQAVAAWAAAFGQGLSDERVPAAAQSWKDIVDRSVECGDDHAIKFTEACRRMDMLGPSQAFRAAASDWVGRIVSSREWDPVQLAAAGIRTRLPA
jgi:hypothetical protein